MKRRDFFDLRRLIGPAAQLAGLFDEFQSHHEHSASDSLLLRIARGAMATSFEVIFPYGTPNAQVCAEKALDLIDRLESQLTVFRDNSEVSQLNARAAEGPVVVETALFDLLSFAKDIHDRTEGAFDVAVGALVKAWGFFRRQGRVPPETEHSDAMAVTGMMRVQLDPRTQSVRFNRAGVEINLGSIGKGYALDCAGRMLVTENRIRSVLLHGGFSSVLAFGEESPNSLGWRVGLADPDNPVHKLGHLLLRDRALATSAATFQHFEHEGRKLGHILDPRTGWPAQGLRSVTVTAPTAAEADALSTAFFILGVDKAREYCVLHPEIGAVLVPDGANRRWLVCGIASFEWTAATSH